MGKRTIATCDLFYAEKHKLGENGIRRKVSTSTGALFSSIALIIIVALIISSTVDFFYSNTITQQSLALNGTTSNNLIIKDTVSSLTIFQGSPFCSKTQITTQNINGNGNLSTSISNSTGNCKIVWTCPNSQFTGISQQICFNFNDPINIAFTSFISYNLNFTSVVDNSLFSLNGNLATNNIYYGTTPTTLDVSIYRSSLITLTGGNWAPVAHLGDYFASVPDNTKNGFYGLVLGLQETTNTGFVANVNGFSFCYQLNLAPETYVVKEISKQSSLNFLAQIGSLSISIIGLVAIAFAYFEFCKNKIRDKVTNNEGKDIELEKKVTDMEELEQKMMISLEKKLKNMVENLKK